MATDTLNSPAFYFSERGHKDRGDPTGPLYGVTRNPQGLESILMINPAASHLDVMVWCLSEIIALSASMRLVTQRGDKEEMPSVHDMFAIFENRLDPVERIFSSLVQELQVAKSAHD